MGSIPDSREDGAQVGTDSSIHSATSMTSSTPFPLSLSLSQSCLVPTTWLLILISFYSPSQPQSLLLKLLIPVPLTLLSQPLFPHPVPQLLIKSLCPSCFACPIGSEFLSVYPASPSSSTNLNLPHIYWLPVLPYFPPGVPVPISWPSHSQSPPPPQSPFPASISLLALSPRNFLHAPCLNLFPSLTHSLLQLWALVHSAFKSGSFLFYIAWAQEWGIESAGERGSCSQFR